MDLCDRYRDWARRLRREHEQACFQYRVKLKPPVFRVDEISSVWGRWDPELREITIAARLVREFPWECVIEVLKHEMAHQYLCENLKIEEGHGPQFREACVKLGVSPWAMRAEGEIIPPLNSAKPAPLDAREARLLERAEKLLALATSTNEHEAAIAMRKVQELYAKHQIESLRAAAQPECVYRYLSLNSKRIERHVSFIASILNDFFFVEVVHASLYSPGDDVEYKANELLGRAENVLMGEYVFSFLRHSVRSLWLAYRKSETKLEKPLRARNSFYLGVLAGFREKLEKPLETQEGGTTHALVVPEDKVAASYVGYRHPRLVSYRHSRRRHDGISFEAGKREGRNLILQRPLSSPSTVSGRLLTR